jgi:peptidoglycan/LPS O-acetylase OafA/YrhL
MNQPSLERIQEGRLLVVLAVIAMVSPEFLGPLLTPELGGMHWPRLVGTVVMAIGVILRVRWVRWVTVGALIVALVVLLVGPAIFTPPVRRIPYLVLLATLDGFALYVLLLSDRASEFFDARSRVKIRDGAV